MPRWTPDGLKPVKRKDLTGLSTYSFNSSEGLDSTNYSSYVIELTDVLPSAAVDVLGRMSGNTGSNYANNSGYRKSNDTGGLIGGTLTGTSFSLSVSSVKPGGVGVTGYVWFHLGSAAGYPRCFTDCSFEDNSSFYTRMETAAALKVTGLATSFDILLSGAGTFTRGSLSFYGIRRLT